jgi:hypothetical protein
MERRYRPEYILPPRLLLVDTGYTTINRTKLHRSKNEFILRRWNNSEKLARSLGRRRTPNYLWRLGKTILLMTVLSLSQPSPRLSLLLCNPISTGIPDLPFIITSNPSLNGQSRGRASLRPGPRLCTSDEDEPTNDKCSFYRRCATCVYMSLGARGCLYVRVVRHWTPQTSRLAA